MVWGPSFPGVSGDGEGDGNAFAFKNVQSRDAFFNIDANRALLETGLPVIVNQGNAITIFIWTGADVPAVYDADLFIEQALNSGPGTLFLGKDGANISSAAKFVNFTSAYGDKALAIGTFFNEKGSLKPVDFRLEKEQTATTAGVFDTQLSAPNDFSFAASISTYTEGFFVRPATTGVLTIMGFAGTTDADPIILDARITISAGDIGNIVEIPFPNGLLATPNDLQFMVLDGVDLFGGLQTTGLFSGQTKAFFQTRLHIIQPTRLVDETELDQFLLLNNDHTAVSTKNGGIAVVTDPTALADTFTDAAFTAGIASTSNPTVQTGGTATFSPNDIVLINHLTDLLHSEINNGLYEVSSHIGTTLTIKGVGTVPTTEDSLKDQFTFIESTGTITKVSVSVLRLVGLAIQHGFGNTTPITFHQLAHASDVPIVATEEFASTNARFFGELGLPNTQGWTTTEVNTGTVVVFADTVFGTEKDVIKHNIAASGDTAKSEIALSGADWTNILTFGASYSGICRITEDISTQSIFSGMGFSSGNDPRPSSIQSRVGIFISENGTHTTITLDGQAILVLDGLSGRPLVLKDAYFSWEVLISPTPDAGVNFGAAVLFVNGDLAKIGAIISSNNAVNDEVSIANSSSTGTTTFYVANFGVTIYEESATKTLAALTMDADIIQVFLPGGKRNYIIILPDGKPRKLGNKLNLIAQNVGGTATVKTENESAPQSLFNGLNNIKKVISSVREIPFVNTVVSGNVYVEDSEILNQDPLGSEPGSVNYDPVKGTMNVRNIFAGSSIQVGQESVVFVVNNTGVTIPDGKVVSISGYDATNDAMEISLALADKVKGIKVLGLSTTTMTDGAVGLITVFGRVNDLDTTSFSVGDIVYLSDTVAGDITAIRPAIPIQIGNVGKVDASTGFIQIGIRELERSIFGGYSHSLDQTFTANVSKPIAFDTNEEFSGIEHSTTVDNSEFTFTSGGVYQTTAEPQYTRTTGGGTDVLNMFLTKDTGSGFVNVPDSNVKFSVNTAGATLVSPLTTTFRVAAGDKIRFMVQVESANLILDAFPASGSAPNDIPATPSIIMNITRIGD